MLSLLWFFDEQTHLFSFECSLVSEFLLHWYEQIQGWSSNCDMSLELSPERVVLSILLLLRQVITMADCVSLCPKWCGLLLMLSTTCLSPTPLLVGHPDIAVTWMTVTVA